MVDKTKLSNSPASSFKTADWSIYLLISSAKRQVFLLFSNMQKLSKDEKVPTFASLLTKFASQINSGYSLTAKYRNLVIRKKTKHRTISLFAVIDNISSILKSPTDWNTFELSNRTLGLSHVIMLYNIATFHATKLSSSGKTHFIVGILALSHLCLLAINFPCQPDVSLTVSDRSAELSPATIFANVYVLWRHASRD